MLCRGIDGEMPNRMRVYDKRCTIKKKGENEISCKEGEPPLDAITLGETLSDDGREIGHLGVPLRTKTIFEPLQNLTENVNGYTLADLKVALTVRNISSS